MDFSRKRVDKPLDLRYNTSMSDPNFKEPADLEIMGDLYEEAMEILRQEFGDALLPDSDIDEDQIMRDFHVDPKH